VIYLDNAATTLYKPPEVGQAMLDALQTAGNPGRGAHAPTLHASRIVYETREALARLFHAEGPACIAFASNATQALNTAINGLFGPGDHVITTVCEHNSVLRPLYRLQRQGVEVSFVDVDANGVLCYAQFEQLLRPNTRGVVVTGASNVTGNRTDLAFVSAFAKKHGLLFGTSICYTSANYKAVTSDEFMDMLISRGVRFNWYFHYMPIGDGANVDLMLNPEQREYMIQRVREIRGFKQWAVRYKGELVWFSICSMGNPHVTIITDDIESAPVGELGPFIENHPAFPSVLKFPGLPSETLS